MKRDVANIVLKVMLIWLLLLFSLLVFRNILPESVLTEESFQSGFLVGGLLAGVLVSMLAVLCQTFKKKQTELPTAKTGYPAVGMMLAVFGTFMVTLSICYDPVLEFFCGSEIMEQDWYTWVKTFVITDVICLLFVMIMASKIQKTPIEKHKMSFGQFICAIFMNAGIIGVGAVMGVVIEFFITYNFGASGGGQTISDLLLESNDFWRILTVGICAPIVEELIFRKFLIDRVHKYGEGMAIFVSGFLFGLFHGNFSQFFFATGVGLFFAFIYVRTGRVWYSILLHMVVNLTTSVITIKLIERLDLEKMDAILAMDLNSSEAEVMAMTMLPAMLLFLGWVLLLVLFVIIGWILWGINGKKLFLKKSEEYVGKKKFAMAFGNFGMIVFLLLCMVRFLSFYI